MLILSAACFHVEGNNDNEELHTNHIITLLSFLGTVRNNDLMRRAFLHNFAGHIFKCSGLRIGPLFCEDCRDVIHCESDIVLGE